MAIKRQKRISKFTEFTRVDDAIRSKSFAEKWALPVDHRPAGGEADEGTRRIPLSRVALLTTSGLVPQSMLPTRVDAVKLGTMTPPAQAGGKWTFVTSENPSHTYVCPGAPGSGEEVPSISDIYAQAPDPSTGLGYQQYRYVDGDNYTGTFVPIPSDLVAVNGKGTRVVDDTVNYTRQIDVAIGSPAAAGAGDDKADGLGISSGNLVHWQSGCTAGTYPLHQSSVPGFGNDMYIPSLTINNTGHVESASTVTVKMPDTEASVTDEGIVSIGTTVADIGGVSGATAGTSQLVSAADHRHHAFMLSLWNVSRAPGVSPTVVTYDGTAAASLDFNSCLHALLPESSPGAAGKILVSEAVSGGTGDGAYRLTWSTMDASMTPEYMFTTVPANTAVPNVSAVDKQLALSTPYASSVIDVANSTIGHLRSGRTYLATYELELTRASVDAGMVDFTIWIANDPYSSPYAESRAMMDQSQAGHQFMSGTMVFTMPAGQSSNLYATVYLHTVDTAATWTCVSGKVQIAELK